MVMARVAGQWSCTKVEELLVLLDPGSLAWHHFALS
jgi:hypothetical protein